MLSPLALDVSFRDQLTAVEIEQAVDRLQTLIKAKYPNFKRIFIEASALKQHQSGLATLAWRPGPGATGSRSREPEANPRPVLRV